MLRVRNGTKQGYDEAHVGDGISLAYPESDTRRGRVGKGCSQTLDCSGQMGTLMKCGRIRRLTPRECFRLQGFPDVLFDKAASVNSDAQLYKQAGNAVTAINSCSAHSIRSWTVISKVLTFSSLG